MGAHQPLEDLGEMSGVEDDQAHPFQHARLDPVDDGVADIPVRHVPPPEEHIGVRQHLIRQPVVRLIQRGRADDHVRLRRQMFGDGAMDPVRVDRCDFGALFFVSPLIPNSNANDGHALLLTIDVGARHSSHDSRCGTSSCNAQPPV